MGAVPVPACAECLDQEQAAASFFLRVWGAVLRYRWVGVCVPDFDPNARIVARHLKADSGLVLAGRCLDRVGCELGDQ